MPGVASYDIVGVKEDVSDIITNISPTDTPFLTMIGTESIHQKLHQWQEDSLQAVSEVAVVEGQDAPTYIFQPTVLRSNNTQIFMNVAQSTGSTEATKTYGRGSELAYQLGMRAKENKRNLENVLVGTAQASAVGNDTTARYMATYQTMLGTTTYYADNTSFTAPGTPTNVAMTESMVLAVLQQLYTNGADPNVLMIKPADSLKVAAFASATGRTRYLEGNTKRVVNVVNVYEHPFSDRPLKVVLNRFQRTADALIFDPMMWKRLVLRNWFRETLAKTGDATKVMIVGEFSLKHKNFAASGRITDLA